jgi:hypothetical protein
MSAPREFPAFVPVGQEHAATVLAVPAGNARGLVILMTGGGGAPRSHRSSLFTRVARALTDVGVASIRIDPAGIGDSTGIPAFTLSSPPVEATLAAARFAIQATGIQVLGMAGNCGGARATMELFPQLPQLRTAALMFLKPLAFGRTSNPAVVGVKGAVSRIPLLGPAARKAYWWSQSGRAKPIVEQLRGMIGKVDLLLLEADSEKAGKLLRGGYGLRGDGATRFEIRELPGGAVRAFRSPERQRFAIDTLVRWFDETLPPGAGGAIGRDGTEVRRAGP